MKHLGSVATIAAIAILKTEFGIDANEEMRKFNETGKIDPGVFDKIFNKPEEPTEQEVKQLFMGERNGNS